MKLNSLKIEATDIGGWESDVLQFGDRMTQLFGPNGCGKTPIIQSVVYALGYPIRFRDDIQANCKAATLKIEGSAGEFTLSRSIESRFDVSVQGPNGETESYYDEREYSQFLFDILEIVPFALTSVRNEPVQPYISTLLPLFYVDQDDGYTSFYNPQAKFIKDQYAEMMRLALGLAPKHSFDRKKVLLGKKRRLDELDREIVSKQELIKVIHDDLGDNKKSSEDVSAELEELRSELDSLDDGRNLRNEADSILEGMIFEKRALQKEIAREVSELESRMSGFNKISNEIEVEIDTLSLNEEARRLFTSFQDICANPNCQLFLGSSESYGKNLLYLRDQMKDLSRNTTIHEVRAEELKKQLVQIEKEISELVKKQDELEDGDEYEALVRSTREITKKIVSLQREQQTLEELEEEERTYVSLLNERESVQNEIAAMGGTASAGDLQAIEYRRVLGDYISRWMDILTTRNVSRDLKIDADFKIIFGNEKVNQFKGSTLSRVVLAFHAALFELYASMQSNNIRFLILDTPRQQDLEADDLGSFLHELRGLAERTRTQVVFSSTEYHYDLQDGDAEWTPGHPGPEQNMFLREKTV